MSLFIAGAIAGASVLAGLLIALSEQIRVRLRHGRIAQGETRSAQVVRSERPSRGSDVSATNTASPESRTAAYREILDALGDDLDEDIAEWEAVLQDFPQVIGAEELRAADDDWPVPRMESAQETTTSVPRPSRDPITPLHRTRQVSADERDMIHRLLRTGFAPEEIALWLNLPLERVQEFLFGD